MGTFVRRAQSLVLTAFLISLIGLSCTQKTNEGQQSSPAQPLVIEPLSEEDVDFLEQGDARRDPSAEQDEVNPLNQCGFADVNDASSNFFDQQLEYTYQRIFNGGHAQILVDIRARLRMASSQLETVFELDLEVLDTSGTDLVSGEPILDTSTVTDGAAEQVAEFNGEVLSEAFPLRSNFHPEWRNILCTLPGAERLVTRLGGYETEVELTPGYPAAISPAADPERYEEELGDYRAFSKVEAKVIRTDNPDLEVGRVYLGSVIVEKIPPVMYHPNGQKIEADLAYRMSFRFGTEELTRALGFLIWTESYIDHESRKFVGMLANMGSQSEINYFLPVNE